MNIYDDEVNNQNRIFGLDLFRALAIIFVIIAHISFLLFSGKLKDGITYYFGTFGVELFFVLSGFLIGTIIIKIFNREENFKFSHIKSFWIRRWFRTLPNYYLILFISLIFLDKGNFTSIIHDARYLSYLVFLQNSITSIPSFFNISWSLAIEEWFYLLLPISLLFISKFKFNKYKSLIIVVIGFILIVSLLRVFIAIPEYDSIIIYDPENSTLLLKNVGNAEYDKLIFTFSDPTGKEYQIEKEIDIKINEILQINWIDLKKDLEHNKMYYFKDLKALEKEWQYIPSWDTGFRKFMPLRLDSIMIGVLAGIICYYYNDFWKKKKIKCAIIGVLILLTSGLYFYYSFDTIITKPGTGTFFTKTFLFNAIGIGTALLFPLGYYIKRPKNEFIAKLIVHISLISYSIYLIHLIIIGLVNKLPLNNINKLFIVLIWIFVISTLQYRLFEKPITSIREKFSKKEEVKS